MGLKPIKWKPLVQINTTFANLQINLNQIYILVFSTLQIIQSNMKISWVNKKLVKQTRIFSLRLKKFLSCTILRKSYKYFSSYKFDSSFASFCPTSHKSRKVYKFLFFQQNWENKFVPKKVPHGSLRCGVMTLPPRQSVNIFLLTWLSLKLLLFLEPESRGMFDRNTFFCFKKKLIGLKYSRFHKKFAK